MEEQVWGPETRGDLLQLLHFSVNTQAMQQLETREKIRRNVELVQMSSTIALQIFVEQTMQLEELQLPLIDRPAL